MSRSDPQLKTLYIPLGVIDKLKQIAPVRFSKSRGHTLFGIRLSPNRTMPQDQWAALYDEGELLFEKVGEKFEETNG